MKQKTQSSLARVADKGMILPFQPLAMTFHHVNYAVDMPKVRFKNYSPSLCICRYWARGQA